MIVLRGRVMSYDIVWGIEILGLFAWVAFFYENGRL